MNYVKNNLYVCGMELIKRRIEKILMDFHHSESANAFSVADDIMTIIQYNFIKTQHSLGEAPNKMTIINGDKKITYSYDTEKWIEE